MSENNSYNEEHFKYILSRMYTSNNLREVVAAYKEGLKFYPQHSNLFEVAADEMKQKIDKNNSTPRPFKVRETQVRNEWFKFFFLSNAIFIFIFSLDLIYLKKGVDSPFKGQMLILGLIFNGFFQWFFYHCAYVKKGTIFLSVALIFGLIYLLSLPFDLINKSNKSINFQSSDIIKIITNFATYVIQGISLIRNFQLLRINREAEKIELMRVLEAEKRLKNLEPTKTLKDLETLKKLEDLKASIGVVRV